jgi:hypothetical protein
MSRASQAIMKLPSERRGHGRIRARVGIRVDEKFIARRVARRCCCKAARKCPRSATNLVRRCNCQWFGQIISGCRSCSETQARQTRRWPTPRRPACAGCKVNWLTKNSCRPSGRSAKGSGHKHPAWCWNRPGQNCPDDHDVAVVQHGHGGIDLEIIRERADHHVGGGQKGVGGVRKRA